MPACSTAALLPVSHGLTVYASRCQKSAKRLKKPYFVALEIQNGGFRDYPKPFSDILRRCLLGFLETQR
jgi:hypothetical protein